MFKTILIGIFLASSLSHAFTESCGQNFAPTYLQEFSWTYPALSDREKFYLERLWNRGSNLWGKFGHTKESLTSAMNALRKDRRREFFYEADTFLTQVARDDENSHMQHTLLTLEERKHLQEAFERIFLLGQLMRIDLGSTTLILTPRLRDRLELLPPEKRLQFISNIRRIFLPAVVRSVETMVWRNTMLGRWPTNTTLPAYVTMDFLKAEWEVTQK